VLLGKCLFVDRETTKQPENEKHLKLIYLIDLIKNVHWAILPLLLERFL